MNFKTGKWSFKKDRFLSAIRIIVIVVLVCTINQIPGALAIAAFSESPMTTQNADIPWNNMVTTSERDPTTLW